MVADSHFGCPKITLYGISYHFRSIFYFCDFFTKWLVVAILDVRKSLLIAFLAISDQYATFFDKMGAVGHFGCPKFTFDRTSGYFRSIGHFGYPKFTFNHKSGHFRLIQNFFWMSEKNFRTHFWPFQIDTFWQNGPQWPFWMGRQCQLSNSSEIFGCVKFEERSLNPSKVIVLTMTRRTRWRLRCWRKHNIPENLRFSLI